MNVIALVLMSEVHLTPEQLEVMALRIRRYFGQPDERPSA